MWVTAGFSGTCWCLAPNTIGNQQLKGSDTEMFFQEMPENAVTDAGKHVPSNPDQYHPSPLI
jgi:hypothetical protein